MKKYLKLRKHTFKNIEIFLVPDGTNQSLTKASSFPINLSVVRKRECQMLGGRPRGMLMPSPGAAIKLRMPTPGTDNEANAPRLPGGAGGGGDGHRWN